MEIQKLGKVECEFDYLNNGRLHCKTHNQTLIYLYKNGEKICQVGEDLMITELGGLGEYLNWINANPSTFQKEKRHNSDFKAHKSSPIFCQECNKQRTIKEIQCGDLDGLCYGCYSKYLDKTS